MIGRTLLQQAVPVTFGLVAAGWLTSLDEARAGLDAVGPRLAVQFGGAAGTLASLGEAGQRVTALLAAELGLAVPVLPWHTDRLRIIDLGAALARVAAALGKIARDVTLLAQSEVGEVSEGGGPDQRGADQRGADQQAPAASPRRGGSSAMPHKHNPVASIAILGCTRQVPGLLATLAAASEQELQRAAGAWHAEWEPLTALLRLTGSASSWAADLLPGLVVDTSRMAANLAATKGLPLAEHVSSLLAGVLGGAQAHDLVAEAGARATSAGLPLRDVLLAVPKLEATALVGRHHRRADRLGARAVRLPRRRRRLRHRARSTHTRTLEESPWMTRERARQGMTVRREVLGDEHVDRAVAATTPFTEPFQDFITRYAWGDIWSRPGLSRAERSLVTLVRARRHAARARAGHARQGRAAQRPDAGTDPGGPAPGGGVRRRAGRQPGLPDRAARAGRSPGGRHGADLAGIAPAAYALVEYPSAASWDVVRSPHACVRHANDCTHGDR